MTRKEEILQAVNNYKNHFPDGFIKEQVYVDGAEWVDANPNEQAIAKYLYEKKGYPIDLNGNIPSFEDTIKDVKLYDTYKRKQFIEKACNWLKDNVSYYIFNFKQDEMIEDFKQAMEK